MTPANETEDDHGRRWAGAARVVGPAWMRLPSLTVGLFGVQMLWSVEMSYASPYLLALGLPKARMAVVFLAGPLSGLIVQPVIGILADSSRSTWGRRRPFILVCAALCALATLLLGFTRPFASVFTAPNSPANDTLTIWLAVLAIYCIDFCINAVQALDRALLVDTLPTSMQPAGNAWAATMLAVGSVAGFFVGNLDLPRFFPFFGSAQLQVLSVIAALLLFLTQAWVCLHVKERVLLSTSSGPKGFRQELTELRETLVRLPSVIRQICWIQFFAWLGWFPVLFYSTVYIGDLHKKSLPTPSTKDAAIALDAESTRLGTRALFYSALLSLAANVIIPSFVAPQHARHASTPLEPKHATWSERVRIHLATLWASSHLVFATCMVATFVTSTVASATLIIAVTGFCWAMTQWAPFALLGEAILAHPALDDSGSICLADTRSTRAGRMSDDETRLLFHADEEGEQGEGEENGRAQPPPCAQGRSVRSLEQEEARLGGLGYPRARVSRIDIATPPLSPPFMGPDEHGPGRVEACAMTSASKTENGEGLSAQAGAIIGIHNMFIVVPQFLVTGLSSIVFALLDPDKSVLHARLVTPPPPPGPGDILVAREEGGTGNGVDSIAVIFRLGGIAAAIAFVLCYRLAKELDHR